MLSAWRRHCHRRAQRRAERLESFLTKKYSSTWHNQCGVGKWYKRRYHKAERRYAKMQCRGFSGKEPTGQYSELNWKGT
jgi:hypothetical protein